MLIILLAPVMGMLWVKLGAANPSIPVKFAMGLILLGVGFLVLAWGAMGIEDGKVKWTSAILGELEVEQRDAHCLLVLDLRHDGDQATITATLRHQDLPLDGVQGKVPQNPA